MQSIGKDEWSSEDSIDIDKILKQDSEKRLAYKASPDLELIYEEGNLKKIYDTILRTFAEFESSYARCESDTIGKVLYEFVKRPFVNFMPSVVKLEDVEHLLVRFNALYDCSAESSNDFLLYAQEFTSKYVSQAEQNKIREAFFRNRLVEPLINLSLPEKVEVGSFEIEIELPEKTYPTSVAVFYSNTRNMMAGIPDDYSGKFEAWKNGSKYVANATFKVPGTYYLRAYAKLSDERTIFSEEREVEVKRHEIGIKVLIHAKEPRANDITVEVNGTIVSMAHRNVTRIDGSIYRKVPIIILKGYTKVNLEVVPQNLSHLDEVFSIYCSTSIGPAIESGFERIGYAKIVSPFSTSIDMDPPYTNYTLVIDGNAYGHVNRIEFGLFE